MFVGETAIGRVIRRTLEVMDEINAEDPDAIRKAGAIDLPTVQRFLNFWFSSSLDLFGSEVSSNAATVFANGLKGRPDEGRYEDHVCDEATFDLDEPDGKGGIRTETVPMRNAMNEVTRNAYMKDCMVGIKRWNRTIKKASRSFELTLPSSRFNRSIGTWSGFNVTPDGTPIEAELWHRRQSSWLPSEEDKQFIHSLMRQVVEPGKMASWIAPPDRGINNLPVNYEYVHLG
jgi:benzoyl-CoA 2,3-dioxygenase component B